MAKIISSHWITLDGYISGRDGSLGFVRGDAQLAEYEIGLIGTASHLLFGRATYEQLSSYWTRVPANPDAADWEKVYGARINPLPKSVLSTTMKEGAWGNTEILENIGALGERARRTEGDMLIYGSASVVQQLTDQDLIDEFHFLIHPVLLGAGKRLFGEAGGQVDLRKTRQEDFASGVVLNVYERVREGADS